MKGTCKVPMIFIKDICKGAYGIYERYVQINRWNVYKATKCWEKLGYIQFNPFPAKK